MRASIPATFALLTLFAAPAAAVDHPHDALRLRLTRNAIGTKSKLVWVSRAPAAVLPAAAPTGVGGTFVATAGGGTASASVALPAYYWRTNPAGTLYKFVNPLAPSASSPSAVKVALVKDGTLLKVVAKHSMIDLDLNGPLGTVSVALLIGSDSYCSTCTAPLQDDAGKFVALECTAPADCSAAFSPCGLFSGIAWGYYGTFEPGEFLHTSGVAIDAGGDVYVADYGGHRIQKFTADGTPITTWGTFGTGPGQFNRPGGVAVDASGDVYVVELENDRVQKFDGSGTYLTEWGGSGAGPGQFAVPVGVAVDASGDVYVTDSNNHRVQKFTASGVFLTEWGNFGTGPGQFFSPNGVATDASGDVYIADFGNSRIQKFTGGGAFVTEWGSFGTGPGQLRWPAGVATDPSGDLYVADFGNNRIQKFSGSGTFVTAWGSVGGAPGLLELGFYSGLATDGSGGIYVADMLHDRIQKFTCPP